MKSEEYESEYRLPSGALGWKDRLRSVYDNDREQWEAFDQIYGLAERLGFDSVDDAWDANPLICGGTNPSDFGILSDKTEDPTVGSKELITEETITKLRTFSTIPELILDGCGFNFAYYGVQSGSQPPVDTELIKDVETFLAPLLKGFSRFCNFTSDGRLRYLTNYNHGTRGVPFVGVAYHKVNDMIRWIEEGEEEKSQTIDPKQMADTLLAKQRRKKERDA